MSAEQCSSIVFYELSRQKLVLAGAVPRSGLYGSTMQTCWLSGLDPNVYVNITGGLRGIIIMSRPGGAVRQHPVPAPHTRRLWIPCGETLPGRHSLWPAPPRKNWDCCICLHSKQAPPGYLISCNLLSTATEMNIIKSEALCCTKNV